MQASINNQSKQQLTILKANKYIIDDQYLYNLSIEYQELIIGLLYSYYKYNLNLKKIINEIKSDRYKYVNNSYLNNKIKICENIIKKNISFVQNYHTN
jgi:hypothetical protein